MRRGSTAGPCTLPAPWGWLLDLHGSCCSQQLSSEGKGQILSCLCHPGAAGSSRVMQGPRRLQGLHTLEMYCWQIMCSPCLISSELRIRKMPRPWQLLSGLQMNILFFLARL